MAANVSANNAVAFGAYQQINSSCAKSNGATTIIHFNRWSVVVCRVMRSVLHRVEKVQGACPVSKSITAL